MRRLAAVLVLLALGCGNVFYGGNGASGPPSHFLVVIKNSEPGFAGPTTFTATWWVASTVVGSASVVVYPVNSYWKPPLGASVYEGILDCGTTAPDGVEVDTPAFPPGYGFVLQAAANNWPGWTPNLYYPQGIVVYQPP